MINFMFSLILGMKIILFREIKREKFTRENIWASKRGPYSLQIEW